MTDTTPSPRPRPVVVVGVVFIDTESLRVAIGAVRGQVYEPHGISVIGGGDAAEKASTALGVTHEPDFGSWLEHLPDTAEFAWLIHGDSRPRPDALGALVDETIRNDASMVGSKILSGADIRMLESIGSSTDVFGELYSGLDPHEVDLEQYDVVRDVASVPAVSILVRRDLLRGLGGLDPALVPPVAGQDLSQRARLAGGRVMMAPSSEVIHASRCQGVASSWRQQAGRMRAMMKAYRLPTLLWVVPVGFLIGVIDAVARLALGQLRPLLDLVRAVGWNLVNLPGTISERSRLARVRQTGDEELFRYQVGGSVLLRRLGSDIGERFGWIVDEEPGVVTEAELERTSSLVAPVVAALTLLVIGIGTRVVWLSTSNAVGFWLPSSDAPGAVLDAYAGGWNPAGLGSRWTMHPAPALVSLVQWLLGGWKGALPLVASASLLAGAIGVPRLLERVGVTGAARHLAAIVFVLGPFAGRFTVAAYWPGLMALGAFPWLVDSIVARWPLGARRRAGRIGQMVVSAGLVAAFAPLAVTGAIVATLLAVLTLRRMAWLQALGWSVVATVVGADLVAPYLLGVSPQALEGGALGVTIWPHPVALGALAVATIIAVLFGPDRASRVAAWGGSMVAVSLLLGVWLDAGEPVVAVVALASLGAALVVGASFEIDLLGTRASIVFQAVAATAGALVVLGSAIALPDGRAGMPQDRWGDELAFASELASDDEGERILLVGDPSSLPGSYRIGNGYAYRLVSGSPPTLDEAWLDPPRIGDAALATVLGGIDAGGAVRPGRRLADFAVRWVVVVDDAPLLEALRSQVDLAERSFDPSIAVFENLSFRNRVTADAGDWVSLPIGAEGTPSDGRVRLADNADPGWRPDWEQAEWANSLSAESGEVRFDNDPLYAGLAWASLAIMVSAVAVAWWGRERSA